MSITGFNHITIAVHDIEESFQFYREVLGFKPILKSDDGAYFLAGKDWFCLQEDKETRSKPLPEYTHIAFTVEPENFAEASQRILDSGAKEWKENVSEGDSLYFLDPNGHKLEIHVSDWKARLEDAKANPWGNLEFF